MSQLAEIFFDVKVLCFTEDNDMNEKDSISNSGSIPRGIEVMLKKASVDPAFKVLLLARRAEAARSIGLTLTATEVLMLQSAHADLLTAMIDKTKMPQEHRRVFLGHAAAAMLAALGVLHSGCTQRAIDGTRPDPTSRRQPEPIQDKKDAPDSVIDDQPE
jgi:hypothetical protein